MLKPNYDLQEAREMLALSYVADLLGPKSEPGKKGFFVTPPANNVQDPLPNDDGTVYPYPVFPIWPQGWQPAVPGPPDNPWKWSILQAAPFNLPPALLNLRMGSNNVIVSYHPGRDAYVVAFAGTENITGMLDDVSFLPVSAGPLDLPLYKSNTSYVSNFNYYKPTPPGGAVQQPPVLMPVMHFGFRFAVEEYTVHAASGKPYNLIELFQKLGKKEIDIYVTGHSLGGGMASVFSAWLQATGIPGVKTNVKMYSFAAPKPGNDVFTDNFDAGLTRSNMAYRVINSLDSVPQLGFTWETFADLNNPGMVKNLIPGGGGSSDKDTSSIWKRMVDKVKELLPGHLPNFNYSHVGSTVAYMGQFPVAFPGTDFPSVYFPGDPNTPHPLSNPNLMQQWWQHWPHVYYEIMN